MVRTKTKMESATICLPENNFEHGEACFVSGWGALEVNAAGPDVLHEVGINLMSEDYCLNNSDYNPNELQYPLEFCAGKPDMNNDASTDPGTDACQE